MTENSGMKQLIERTEALDCVTHHGATDPNLVIYDELQKRDDGGVKAARYLKYREHWEAVRRGEKTADFPMFVTYGLIDACNLSCLHCYRQYNPDTDIGKRLSVDDVKRTLDELRELGCYSVDFGSGGELFVYKQATEIIRHASDLGFEDIWLSSNGHMLTEERAEMILENDITRLLVSLDAVSEETYGKARGKRFYRVMANLFRFLDKRSQLKTRLPVLRVSMISYNVTEHETDAFIAFWRNVADEVDIQQMIDVKGVDEFKYDTIDDPHCDYPNNMLYIDWNGDYRPCCVDASVHLPLGNINQMSVAEVWRSERMEDLRSQLRGEKSLNKVCVNCLHALKNSTVYE